MKAFQIFTISKIYFLQIKDWAVWFFLYTLFFPVGLVFFIKVIGNDTDSIRLVAGATTLSISIVSINSTAYWIMTDRFQHRLELIKSMPLTPYGYYFAIILVSAVQTTINVHVLIGVMRVLGCAVKYSAMVPITIIATTSLFSVFGIFIGNKAKDTSHGSLMMNLFGTGAVLICPIFYPISVLPESIAGFAVFLPHMLAFQAFYFLYS